MKKSHRELIEQVFLKYPGSELVEYLKDGACIQCLLDGDEFTLEKRQGKMILEDGGLDYPDFRVELNETACEYLASSPELKDFVTRTRECIRGEADSCYMTYQVTASLPYLLSKGYLEFARKMGILP